MKYMLLIHADQAEMLRATEEDQRRMLGAYLAYTEALKGAGAYISGERLQPPSASTTVRVRDDRTNVLDGPYADSKEQLAGFYMIEAPDLDAALAWAARCPGAAHGTIEVRPIWAY